jgi:hypothetical protein
MTIIQAQPLKQFGISGPASALDNELSVFDGITGKKIKAATGITSPSSGRLDLAEIDVDEIGNSAGDLKLQADVQGDVVLFGDTDVGDAEDGKALYIYRKATEGDRQAKFYINQWQKFVIETNADTIFDVTGGSNFQFAQNASAGTRFEFGSQDPGVNVPFRYKGWLTAPAATKYVEYKVDDVSDNFTLARQDSNIGYFDIQMPTIITGGNVGIGTIGPATSAKLELSSTTGALLLTRMTTAQRDALTAVNGMVLYNLTTNKFQAYENGAWANLI